MSSTRERILDSAQALAQLRGYNGFSYADISSELTITKASIHHHFPTKGQLAEALVKRYRVNFDAARRPLEDPGMDARSRLQGYADLYAEPFTTGGRMCLCGILLADAQSLPENTRAAVVGFFEDQRHWIADVLGSAGMPRDASLTAATTVVAALEGSLLMSRATPPGSPPNLVAVGQNPHQSHA